MSVLTALGPNEVPIFRVKDPFIVLVVDKNFQRLVYGIINKIIPNSVANKGGDQVHNTVVDNQEEALMEEPMDPLDDPLQKAEGVFHEFLLLGDNGQDGEQEKADENEQYYEDGEDFVCIDYDDNNDD